MTEFAHVMPPQVWIDWPERDMPRRHLLLAHDVVKKPVEYRNVVERARFARVKHIGRDDLHIIMDNSVVETGGAVDLEMVHEACMIVGANVACLPDVIGDAGATVDATNEAWGRWVGKFDLKKPSFTGWEGFMIIPQGNNLKEWVDCYADMPANVNMAPWIGIPRWLGDHDPNGSIIRYHAALLVAATDPRRKIHYLGFCENISGDILACTDKVTSIDSAVPMRHANLVPDRRMRLNAQLPKRGNWWEAAKYDPQMLDNSKEYSHWIR